MKFHEKDILKFFFSQIFHHNLKETSHLTREIVLEKLIFWLLVLFIQFILWLWKLFDPFCNESKGYPFTKIDVFLIILMFLGVYLRKFEFEKMTFFQWKFDPFLNHQQIFETIKFDDEKGVYKIRFLNVVMENMMKNSWNFYSILKQFIEFSHDNVFWMRPFLRCDFDLKWRKSRFFPKIFHEKIYHLENLKRLVWFEVSFFRKLFLSFFLKKIQLFFQKIWCFFFTFMGNKNENLI